MSTPQAAEPAEALQYVLANVDDARGHLEQAQAALATATVYGRLAVANDEVKGNE